MRRQTRSWGRSWVEWLAPFVGAIACASSPEAPAKTEPERTVTTAIATPPDAAPVVVRPPPPPPPPPPCPLDPFLGPWLLESGTASLSCDDGSQNAVPAGGNVRLEATGTGALFVDGDCRFPMIISASTATSSRFDGCTLRAVAGAACTMDGVAYALATLEIERDGSGTPSLTYALDRADPDRPSGRCTDRTNARLLRAAGAEKTCATDGTWQSLTTASGAPTPVRFTVNAGRCTFEAPGYKTRGRCKLERDRLTFTDEVGLAKSKTAPACKRGASAAYVVTFANDCTALELEARGEPCTPRQDAIEFLLFRKQP